MLFGIENATDKELGLIQSDQKKPEAESVRPQQILQALDLILFLMFFS